MPYKDPEQRRDYHARYRAAHLEERRADDAVYYRAHQEEKAANREIHREEKRTRDAAYYDTHPEKMKARAATYAKAHPEVYRIATSRRDARKKGLPATLTVEQWQAIKVAYRNRCVYCGGKPEKLTQDHVIPLSKGGGTTADNIVPACQSCNSRKHTGPPPRLPALRLML